MGFGIQIFSDGAYLEPYQFPDGRWGWVLDDFASDSQEWVDGEEVEVLNEAGTEEELLGSILDPEEDEDEEDDAPMTQEEALEALLKMKW